MAEADPGRASSAGPKILNVHQAKTHLSKLLKRAHAGEEITLFKAGKPYAKLVPFDVPPPSEPRRPGGLKGSLPASFFDPLPPEEMIGLVD